MKIAFLIANTSPGIGGHFWDLRTHVDVLAGHVEAVVVDMGYSPAAALQSSAFNSNHIPLRGWTLPFAAVKLLRLLQRERVDLIHLYDNRLFFLAGIWSQLTGKPILFTKCGGPNPTGFYPAFDDLIVFSRENERFFRSSRRYAGSGVHYLPNRVAPVRTDPERGAALRALLPTDRSLFLLISRLTPFYREFFRQGMRLVRRLNEDGHPALLVVVGASMDPELKRELERAGSETVRLFCGKEFTYRASELLDVGSFALGMGRTFMEASSAGKILLTPRSEGRFPVLVDEGSFPHVFDTNFSPRNQVPEFDEEANYRRIVRAVRDQDYAEELRRFARGVFRQHFDVSTVTDRYLEIYRDLRRGSGPRLWDMLRGLVYCVKSFSIRYG